MWLYAKHPHTQANEILSKNELTLSESVALKRNYFAALILLPSQWHCVQFLGSVLVKYLAAWQAVSISAVSFLEHTWLSFACPRCLPALWEQVSLPILQTRKLRSRVTRKPITELSSGAQGRRRRWLCPLGHANYKQGPYLSWDDRTSQTTARGYRQASSHVSARSELMIEILVKH